MLLATPVATVPFAAQAEEGTQLVQIVDAAEVEIDAFKWTNRVLLVLAENPNDPRFLSQMDLISQDPNALFSRDVVIVTDTHPDTRSVWRKKYRSSGFGIVLLAKDGTVTLRKPRPWPMRDISHSIDKLPLRKQEIRDGS